MGKVRKGLTGAKEMVVGPGDLASFTGNIGAEVLSTHRVVLLMEQAARVALEGRLDKGMMTVGTGIRIRHVAATPLGATVRAEARVRTVEGRRIVFDVRVYDEAEMIAEGENERLVVSMEGFLQKVDSKREELQRNKET